MSREQEKRAFARIMLPFFMQGYAKGIEQGERQKKTRKRKKLDAKARRKLEQEAMRQAGEIVETTFDDVQSLVTVAVQQGKGVQELGRDIATMFGQKKDFRSLRIARTELTRTINDGTLQTLIDEGYTEKEWLTVIDGAERPTHAAAHGQVVPIDQPFNIGGYSAMAPGDTGLPVGELVNCRCALAGAGVPEDRKKVLGEAFLRTHGSLERTFVVALRRAFDSQLKRILAHFPS